jgi:hypothetical protein
VLKHIWVIIVSGSDLPFGDGGAPGSGGADSRNRTTAPVELIDIIFALSNISLVREIVQENLIQIEELSKVSKGQTEGLRLLIVEKQKQVFTDLIDIEHLLNGILNDNVAPAHHRPSHRDFNLDTQQSKALVYALSFAINHLIKFIPGVAGGSSVPGVII